MLNVALMIAEGILWAGFIICFYRLCRGPSWFDRVLAFEAISFHFVATVLVSIIRRQSNEYFDGVVLLMLFSFVTTVFIASHLEGYGRE